MSTQTSPNGDAALPSPATIVAPGVAARDAAALAALFSDFRPVVVAEAAHDFSGLHRGADVFCQVAPRSVDELAAIVRLAHRHGVPLRTRGRNHNTSGSSLPVAGELAISSARLNWLAFEEDATVTAGAGLVLWTIGALLQEHDYALPVVNFGYPASTVGGYVSAGGYGPGAITYGGFWENVAEVTLVDGRGEVRRLRRTEPTFPWLFGAMGQLGIIAEAKLDIIPSEPDLRPAYPRGVAVPDDVLVEREQFVSDMSRSQRSQRGRLLYWLTYFVARSQAGEAVASMQMVEDRNAGDFDFLERHICPITFRGLVAPLIYPRAEPFVAVGTWAWHEHRGDRGLTRVRQLDDEFAWVALMRGYCRYIQSELPSGPKPYELYWGTDIYARLREHKLELDSAFLFNRGSVFAPPG